MATIGLAASVVLMSWNATLACNAKDPISLRIPANSEEIAPASVRESIVF